MVKMTLEHKNEKLKELIASLKKQAMEKNSGLWKRVALELERPTRNRRVVNLSRLEKYCKDNDVIVVPGKLLSGGDLNKKLTIITFAVSRATQEKLGKSTVLSIEEGLKKYPDGKNIKIIGWIKWS